MTILSTTLVYILVASSSVSSASSDVNSATEAEYKSAIEEDAILVPASAAALQPGSFDSTKVEPNDFVKLLLSERLTITPRNRQSAGWRISLNSGLVHSTNAYGNSNLASGGRIREQSDQVFDLGASASGYFNLSDYDQLSGSIGLSRQFYKKKGELSYSSLSGSAKLTTYRLPGVRAAIAYSCGREFENGLVYSTCGPEVSVSNASAPNGFHFEGEVAGFYRNGRSLYFEDFYGGRATVLAVGGGQKSSFYGGVQYLFRHFQGGYGGLLGFKPREDHRLQLPVGIERKIGNHLFVSFGAVGSVNWSNYDEYRYWDISLGPKIRLEIAR